MKLNKNGRTQRGLSSIGLLMVVALGAFFLLCGLKLIPLYLDSWFVQGSLNKMRDEDLAAMTNTQIRTIIDRHFAVDGIQNVSMRDVKIERDKGRVTLKLDYEKRINFLGNLDVVASFSNVVDSADKDD